VVFSGGKKKEILQHVCVCFKVKITAEFKNKFMKITFHLRLLFSLDLIHKNKMLIGQLD